MSTPNFRIGLEHNLAHTDLFRIPHLSIAQFSSLVYPPWQNRSTMGAGIKKLLYTALTLILLGICLVHGTTTFSFSAAPLLQATHSPLPVLTGKLVFVLSSDDTTSEIYTMNADGSNLHALTHDGVTNWYPAFSPDGTQIAFYTVRNGVNSVYVMNADGSNERFITNGGYGGLSWSPDGKQLVFASETNASSGIYKVDIDGQNSRTLVVGAGLHVRPNWSPDGKHIIFEANDDNIKSFVTLHVYIMDADGSNKHKLIPDASPLTSLTWWPDSQTIAFTRYLDSGNSAPELTLVSLDGSNKGHFGSDNDVDYVWSPDGKYLMAWALNTTDAKTTSDLVLLNADGSGRTILAHFDKLYRLLSWGE